MMKLKTYNIAIIGAGQLGSRHLQSLKQLDLSVNLYIVDSNPISLEKAKELYKSVPENSLVLEAVFTDTFEDLPSEVNLCVIATSASGRAELIQCLIEQKSIENLLIEKVLFQSEDDYGQILTLLRDKKIRAWVNCPRRLYPIYQKIKDIMSSEKNIHCIIDGNQWGLGCNSIHFIDMFKFIIQERIISINTESVDKVLIESKRPGYVEFTGSITVFFESGSTLTLSSRKDAGEKFIIYFSGNDSKIIVDESNKHLTYFRKSNNWKLEEEDFLMPYQSELTSKVAKDILLSRETLLPDYKESMDLHLPFISSLLKFLSELQGEKVEKCLIT